MKIWYYALGLEDTASSRLRVYMPAEALRDIGHDVCTRVAYADVPSDIDVVVVQKRQDFNTHIERWRRQGVPVVFDIDDPTDRLPECSLLTVGSKVLRSKYPDSVYIPDCLDVDHPQFYEQIDLSDELKRVCWFGLGCNAYHAKPVKEACESLGLQLVMITDLNSRHYVERWSGVQYIEWNRYAVDSVIRSCDLVVCPYTDDGPWDKEWIQAKGENRLLKAWALGMPVVGAPIPSYVEHGLVHTATTVDEWLEALVRMKSVSERASNAERGRRIALTRVAKFVAEEWQEVFRCVTI